MRVCALVVIAIAIAIATARAADSQTCTCELPLVTGEEPCCTYTRGNILIQFFSIVLDC